MAIRPLLAAKRHPAPVAQPNAALASCIVIAVLAFVVGIAASLFWRAGTHAPADCFALGTRDCAVLSSGQP